MPAVASFSSAEVTQRSAAIDYATEVVADLPRLSKLVVLFHYVEHMTLPEIALALDLPEPRVRRVHDEAVRRIRAGLAL